jgi:predicted amidohydrolase
VHPSPSRTVVAEPSETQRRNVGLIQMNCRLGDRAANLAKAERHLQRLAGRTGLACLPEMFDLGYDLPTLGPSIFDLAEVVPGPTTERLGTFASRFDLAIVAGVTERDSNVTGLLFDSTVIIGRDGALHSRYRKSHLYPDEHRVFRPGHALPVVEVDGLRLGVAICFELAFPPIFSTLARRGAQLVLNPSAVPTGYGHLQDVRTRARAQDNQIFVAAVNHVGREGDVSYCGGTQLADPRGDLLAKATDHEEEVLVVDLPLERIDEQRRQEPVFRGMRSEQYES